MYQTWDKLLFLHWPIAAELLRPLIAPRLCLDTFEGRAWVGVTPFTMWGIRPTLLPSLPVLSQSHELNVRTYVHMEGMHVQLCSFFGRIYAYRLWVIFFQSAGSKAWLSDRNPASRTNRPAGNEMGNFTWTQQAWNWVLSAGR